MAMTQIIEIDDVEGRRNFVLMLVLEPGIIYNYREVVIFEVIDKHGKALPDMLCDDVSYHEVGFSGSR